MLKTTHEVNLERREARKIASKGALVVCNQARRLGSTQPDLTISADRTIDPSPAKLTRSWDGHA